jgi:hypothetical protein
MNQFATAYTNTTAAIVHISENLLGHGYSVRMYSFYNLSELAQFMKSKNKQTVLNFTC